jgi:CheY-like chemotaxis protein
MYNEPSILLIEDNPEDSNTTSQALKNLGFEFPLHLYNNGDDALEFLYKKKLSFLNGSSLPSLILLDLNLPGIDGREILSTIKSDKILKRIPVIIMSTANLERGISSFTDNQADGYIHKPLNFNDLFNSIGIFIKVFSKTARYQDSQMMSLG